MKDFVEDAADAQLLREDLAELKRRFGGEQNTHGIEFQLEIPDRATDDSRRFAKDVAIYRERHDRRSCMLGVSSCRGKVRSRLRNI